MTVAPSTAAAGLMLTLAAPALAQIPACTDSPGLPENVTATLVPPQDRAGSAPLPAVLVLAWEPPISARERPADAPDAYVIEAGSGPSFADVASVATSGPVTRYQVPLPNGTFFVRLRSRNACGTSGATPEVEVLVRGSTSREEPNPLVLLDSVNAIRERLADTAFIRVMGRVRNGWLAAPATFVEVTAVFDGPGGESSDTASAYVNGRSARLTASNLVTDTVLEPGGTGCFLMFAVFPAFQITGVRFDIISEAIEVQPLEGRVDVRAVRQVQDEFGDLRLEGRLVNTGTVYTWFNEAWLEVTDGTGRVQDCDSAQVNGSRRPLDDGLVTGTRLAPAADGPYGTGTEIVFRSGLSVRAWTTWQEAPETASATERYRDLLREFAAMAEVDEQLSSPQDRTALRDALRREARAIELNLTQ